jgi:transcriptional regulator with XRE-family HTH domain
MTAALALEAAPSHVTLPGLGAAIRAARERAELTQAQLGEAMGYDPPGAQSAVARFEREFRDPALHHLAAIADATGCELVVELRPRAK